jgi:class 3 adenylate cyclase
LGQRLAAILFTDIVGYTAAMAESEVRDLSLREDLRLQELARKLRLSTRMPTM